MLISWTYETAEILAINMKQGNIKVPIERTNWQDV